MAATPSFEPVRAQWLGIRTSNPATAGLGLGAWWYRSDLGVFAYWDGTTIQYWGGSGGTIHSSSGTLVVAISGDYNVTVTMADMTVINHVIDVQFDTSPKVDPGSEVGIKITGAIVGFTLIGVGAGTTITSTVKAMGW
jgi:hypothetical protein